MPARLDHLPWRLFHTEVVFALGITWVLDGLEVTLAGAVGSVLKESPALRMSDAQVGLAASLYLTGAVFGAFLFGWLTDRFGRKPLYFVTLGVYLSATAASALAWDAASFVAFRFLTGAGIGGEYTAINSAIQELIPARYRGRTDLIVNGSFWIGAALGALGTIFFLNTQYFAIDRGWRMAFGMGVFLGFGILFLRRFVPESPRWLITHGHIAEAERIVAEIERRCGVAPAPDLPRLRLHTHTHSRNLVSVAIALCRDYPRRAAVSLLLMAAQAFFYNAIFFTYALVLSRFFDVPARRIGLFILPFALGNFLGPVMLGRWFDTIGRKPMIAVTYVLSGLLLIGNAVLFADNRFDALTQTIAWTVIFFVASAAASSAYLTVGESFPLEVRAMAIAVFYALGTGLGGIAGPWLFGILIGTGQRDAIAWGYVFGAAMMLLAGAAQACWGLKAERRALEELAPPLSAIENPDPRPNPRRQLRTIGSQ